MFEVKAPNLKFLLDTCFAVIHIASDFTRKIFLGNWTLCFGNIELFHSFAGGFGIDTGGVPMQVRQSL